MQQQAPWLVANRYQVGEVVGRGGYGMVCRGVDLSTGKPVALKMLSPEAGRDPNVVERMLREQQALVALTGTCAVTAIDLCRLESGAPCLVMEWLEGRDLEQQLSDWEERGQLGGLEELLRLLEPLTQTLERAHDLGLVHRDIKPANVFVTDGGAGARLLDFGLSRMKSAAPLTQIGMVMGSPSYIAPETWRGNSSALDGRADLFSLAVIVFRWLTGKLPFDAPDLLGKMTAVTSGPRPSVVALRPDLATPVDAWMARALAVEPDARFQSAQDLYLALDAVLKGEELPRSRTGAPSVRVAGGPAGDVAQTATPLEAPGKGPLVAAWRTAAALLKRFTGPRDGAPTAPVATAPTPAPAATAPVATTPTPAPRPSAVPSALAVAGAMARAMAPKTSIPPAPKSGPGSARPSIWLESSELEDVASDPTAASSPPEPKAKPKPKRNAKAKAKAKPKKTRKKSGKARKEAKR